MAEKKSRAKYIGIFPLEFAEAEGVSIPGTIHLIPIGQWEHDLYGPILITFADIREFAQNFNAGVRKGVFITAGHEGFEELPATGWITSVEAKEDGLWGDVEWNELGKATLSDKQYKFFSPEFCRDFEDPQTHQLYRNVLTGGALTKSPYFKELEAIVFSEKNLKAKFNTSENNIMNLQELLAKKIEELTDEEKAFIKAHKDELTEEQKVSHTAVVDDASTETEEEKTAREEKEKGDANEAAGLNRDGSAKEDAPAGDGTEVKASEKVTINASELKILREKADQGALAFADLEKRKLDDSVGALTYSATNKNGKFLPKTADKLRTFMAKLSSEQRLAFSALVNDLPKTQVFNEEGGSANAAEGTAEAEVEAKVAEKIAASEKSGKTMKYSEALRLVMSENEGLETRFDSELKPIRASKA